MRRVRSLIVVVIAGAATLAVGAMVTRRLVRASDAAAQARGPVAAPVETAPIRRGRIDSRRTFSGSLQPVAQTTLAPKVAGRIVTFSVDLADTVERGQVVARLEAAEFEQVAAQAEAELAVAKAELVEAESGATIAEREIERIRTLHERGVASDSQLDTARADYLARSAAVEVAKAQVMRAEAALETARIRLSYSTIRAEWEGGADRRIVAQRFVEEGDTVSANTPLVSIIELDPIEAVIFATERDYALLAPGQSVTLATDAFPGRRWEGQVARVSPIFREGSRQARIEVSVPNADTALKPGMFVRVEAVLGGATDATVVPAEALVDRDGRTVIFVVDGDTARMVPVEVGIREEGFVQVIGEGIEGEVITLGQQLIGDGSPITVPDRAGEAGRSAAGGES